MTPSADQGEAVKSRRRKTENASNVGARPRLTSAVTSERHWVSGQTSLIFTELANPLDEHRSYVHEDNSIKRGHGSHRSC